MITERPPCWNCNKKSSKTRFFCTSCEKIQEPTQNMNAYEFFTLPVQFHIDFAKLEVKYLQLSQLLHPDRYYTGSSREKLYAAMHTANLNEAHKKLKDTVLRGRHILEIVGYNKSMTQDRTIQSSDLLQEAFEDQEAIESAQDYASYIQLIKSIHNKQLVCYERIARAFQDQDYCFASLELDRYRYYDKVLSDSRTFRQEHIKDSRQVKRLYHAHSA